MSPGKNPIFSVATTGRTITILPTNPKSKYSKAFAAAKNVFPVPADPVAKTTFLSVIAEINCCCSGFFGSTLLTLLLFFLSGVIIFFSKVENEGTDLIY